MASRPDFWTNLLCQGFLFWPRPEGRSLRGIVFHHRGGWSGILLARPRLEEVALGTGGRRLPILNISSAVIIFIIVAGCCTWWLTSSCKVETSQVRREDLSYHRFKRDRFCCPYYPMLLLGERLLLGGLAVVARAGWAVSGPRGCRQSAIFGVHNTLSTHIGFSRP